MLSDICDALVVSCPPPKVDTEFEDVPGLDGYMHMGTRILPRPISVKMFYDGSIDERSELMRIMMPALLSSEPVKVELGRDNGWYRMCVPSGDIDSHEFVTSGQIVISFQPLHSAMFGDEITVYLPSGGSVSFDVGGNYKTYPKITANAYRNTSSHVWGVRLDDGDYVHVDTGVNAYRSTEIDCMNRVCKLSNSVVNPTLDSDWLELSPGRHTIRMDNGISDGSAKISWVERWI